MKVEMIADTARTVTTIKLRRLGSRWASLAGDAIGKKGWNRADNREQKLKGKGNDVSGFHWVATTNNHLQLLSQ